MHYHYIYLHTMLTNYELGWLILHKLKIVLSIHQNIDYCYLKTYEYKRIIHNFVVKQGLVIYIIILINLLVFV